MKVIGTFEFALSSALLLSRRTGEESSTAVSSVQTIIAYMLRVEIHPLDSPDSRHHRLSDYLSSKHPAGSIGRP